MEAPEPLLELPLRRLELDSAQLVGAGYDLVDVRVLPPEGEPTVATFMLDSGLTLNLVTPELASDLGLPLADGRIDASALGGEAKRLVMASMPGLELVAREPGNATCYSGVWEGGGGWRALASLDWDSWVAEAERSGGQVANGAIRYTCLPSLKGENYVGLGGTEFVAGAVGDEGTSFAGGGVSVEPKGFLAVSDRYEFRKEGEELVEASSGMRMRPSPALTALPLGPVLATAVPFTQAELAARQGVKLQGMLGQYPLHREFALDLDAANGRLSVYRAADAGAVADAQGLLRLPGQELGSGLVSVRLAYSPLAPGRTTGREGASVPAMVDTGSANTILNWPAAEQLLGLRSDDRIVREAPLMRAVGVGGGQVEMPLLTLSVGLLVDGEDGLPLLRAQPVRVAIGDVNVFEDLVGREDQGSWPFGLGPKRLKPAALLGQDVLSQQRYLFSASDPALYMQRPSVQPTGRLEFVGVGDCLDSSGRRLRGVQRLSCTPDLAARECLRLPAGACRGIAVTPLDMRGSFSGLCYVFVDSDDAAVPLLELGFQRYMEGPNRQELAPVGATVEASTGDQGADCFRWHAA